MHYKEYVPNERIVDRACTLWMAMLRNPKYDNLGSSAHEAKWSDILPSLLAQCGKKPSDETIARFGVELKKVLMAPLEWTADSRFEKDGKPTTYTTLFNHLSVDYGPDIPLSTAAKRAGLEMEFPWKTSMFLREDCLYLGYGYGAPYVYHYPLTGDRWLETTLCGGDMPKIIALVEAGVLDLNLNLVPCPTST